MKQKQELNVKTYIYKTSMPSYSKAKANLCYKPRPSLKKEREKGKSRKGGRRKERRKWRRERGEEKGGGKREEERKKRIGGGGRRRGKEIIEERIIDHLNRRT